MGLMRGRFHSIEDAPYYLPNDEDEVERLQDLQHCIKLFFGRNIIPAIAPNPSLIGNSQILIPCCFVFNGIYPMYSFNSPPSVQMSFECLQMIS